MNKMSTTTDLGNGIDANDFDGNINLSTLARHVRSIKRARAEHESLGTDSSWMDAHTLTHGEHLFVTPGGEVVHVSTVEPVEGGDGIVHLIYPERDALDAAGNPVPYSYNLPVQSLIARMEADGGWTLMTDFERIPGTVPSCPRCHKFMTVGEDEWGFPFAQCVCGADVGHEELIEQGVVYEVF